MKNLAQWLHGLDRSTRLRLIVGVCLIGCLTVWLGYRTLQVRYDVLFTQLAEADAAAIVDRLKQLKVPYRLADDGATIEVAAEQVHEVRLRLMSGGVPLSGAVGFELFDKQGLGATEESQRVSYQRALQGELARTISTLNDVKYARVNLVLPESSLFKRDRQEARAAVTLTTKAGAVLTREQILGVQRLVAASVAGLDPGKVVVTDQRGITLSGPDSFEGASVASEARLGMKRDIEDYVGRKIARLLDSTYGPGQAIVSVDVALNFDEIHRTVQDLEPSVRRKRQSYSGNSPAAGGDDAVDAAPAAALAHSTNGNSSTEVEYEYGRRVEQVIAAPGGITRISVGVVVPGALTTEKQQRITELVRMAAGINEQRGDAVVVQPLDQLGGRVPVAAISQQAQVVAAPLRVAAVPISAGSFGLAQVPVAGWMMAGLIAVLIVALVLIRRRRDGASRREEYPPLEPQERQLLLLEIEQVLGGSAVLAGAREKP